MRGIAALFVAPILAAQQPAAPRFEVVSIRPVPANAPPVMRDIDFTPVRPGGQFIDSSTNLLWLISFAYQVQDPAVCLVGLPKWAESQSFSVSAKPAEGFPLLPPEENRAQVRAMVRSMLKDRFHLRLHTEDRQEHILSLEKGGLKIHEVDAPVPPAKDGPVGAAMSDEGGRLIGRKSTMAGLARALVIFEKRPVVDNTGLTGYYDFDIRWKAPERTAESSGLGPDGIALLHAAIEDQLGLRLRAITGTVRYWVVDHVEQPTAN
ncbi:MAG TPA: TIGR03435 family protein [Bryobacteraceae bacterium]|nr:TIGR03435 family protein [Bryobacteraceae bacterium]